MAPVRYTQAQMEQRVRESLEHRQQRGDINQMMGLSLEECNAETGSVHLSHQMAPWETNVMDTMHGGLIAFLLDSTMAITARACTGDHRMPTSDIHVNFLRPVQQNSTVHISAAAMHIGRHMIQMRGELWTDSPNRLCASATATFYRIDTASNSKN